MITEIKIQSLHQSHKVKVWSRSQQNSVSRKQSPREASLLDGGYLCSLQPQDGVHCGVKTKNYNRWRLLLVVFEIRRCIKRNLLSVVIADASAKMGG